MRAPNMRKSIVTDIYDEDHYTLARNSGILTDQLSTYQDDTNQRNDHAKSNGIKKTSVQ